ncbi:MAG: DUF86 domain-containing protein [Desulfarculaceae bacterium]|nr:DUF86 domain-containing protein [Desulfarculaceae bacterium]
MPEDYRPYLDAILESMARIRDYLAGMDFKDFQNAPQAQEVAISDLQAISEAASRLPDKLRSSAPRVPWRKIIALREELAHQDEAAALALAWEVVHHDLEPLGHGCYLLLEKLTPRGE